MPGSVGVVTGFVDREIGKSIYAASSLQRVGKGGALAASGGNILCFSSAAGVGNGSDTNDASAMPSANERRRRWGTRSLA